MNPADGKGEGEINGNGVDGFHWMATFTPSALRLASRVYLNAKRDNVIYQHIVSNQHVHIVRVIIREASSGNLSEALGIEQCSFSALSAIRFRDGGTDYKRCF